MLRPALLKRARAHAEAVLELERQSERARADYHHAIRQLYLNGGTMREIAAALGLSHQRVGQIVKAGSTTWLDRLRNLTAGERRLACTFCGRRDSEVEKLVAGPDVYICDGCIQSARCVAKSGDRVKTPAPLEDLSTTKLRCSFCAKGAKGSRQLLGGGAARICSDCLAFAEKFAEED